MPVDENIFGAVTVCRKLKEDRIFEVSRDGSAPS